MSLLSVKDLSYIYSKDTPFQHTAVDGVSFDVERGDFIGIIGHTGSGKSTLVQMLNGLLKPSAGTITLDGVNIWDKPKEIRKIRFKVGLVFQYPEYQLFEETVEKDISFGPGNMGLSEDEIKERVRNAAKFVDLKDDLQIICISRAGKVIIPHGSDEIMPEDLVVVITKHKGLNDLNDILRG